MSDSPLPKPPRKTPATPAAAAPPIKPAPPKTGAPKPAAPRESAQTGPAIVVNAPSTKSAEPPRASAGKTRGKSKAKNNNALWIGGTIASLAIMVSAFGFGMCLNSQDEPAPKRRVYKMAPRRPRATKPAPSTPSPLPKDASGE
jgi:hypothetical protein